MDGRVLMLLYGSAAAGITWLLLKAYGMRVERRSPLQPVLLVLSATLVSALVVWMVLFAVHPQPLDLEFYPVPGRVLIFMVISLVGWMMSFTGLRRWRSAVTLQESQAAFREGLWTGFQPLGQLLIRVGFIAVALAMAMPEWFLGQ